MLLDLLDNYAGELPCNVESELLGDKVNLNPSDSPLHEFNPIFPSLSEAKAFASKKMPVTSKTTVSTYISGARSVVNEQVRIASQRIYGIRPKKAIHARYRLGISGNIKIKELTKYQIDQIEQMIGKDHVVHWELKRGERPLP
ncbi:hypothetical protein DM860_014770 [Cuscuta australis]|uniref:Uncharacterized protein n=1 Tax=Cuscuta australis TaxID=267555 RepID=A0A328D0C9_9ASTE|nr:hypothetical protein DM860_014770 [Cuscuta australis]